MVMKENSWLRDVQEQRMMEEVQDHRSLQPEQEEMEHDLVVLNKRDFDLVRTKIGTSVEAEEEEEEGHELLEQDFLFEGEIMLEVEVEVDQVEVVVVFHLLE